MNHQSEGKTKEKRGYKTHPTNALWSGTNKNRVVSTGPLAHPFARSLAPLTRSLARSLRSLPSLWESELLDGYLFCVLFLFWPIV